MESYHACATIVNIAVVRAARQLDELSERFREVEYNQIEPLVWAILGKLTAADALQATRRFGLSMPRSRRECIEAVARAVAERKESWDRCASIGGSPFLV